MNLKKLHRIRQAIETLRRRRGIKSKELEALARALGRTKYKRGKEPTWINDAFKDLRPISIPHHSSEPNIYTANNILDQLEIDLERIEESISDRPERKDI